ncbi:MAG: VTT domain-containing protein [Calditrichia bacterium]
MTPRQMTSKQINWTIIIGIVATSLTTGMLLLSLFPDYRGLITYGLFSIPSHMLVGLIPQEPILLVAAKYASPLYITLVAAIGYTIASLLDYLLLLPLLNRNFIQDRIEDSSFYQRARRYFRKSPFMILLAANALPLPFYPLKFLSIVSHYPFWRYISAMFLGRLPRYYLIAYLGFAFEFPTWALVAMLAAFLLPALIHRFFKSNTTSEPEAQNSISSQEDTQPVL